MKQLELLISAMRPKQWIKNLFIFVALIFSLNFFNANLILKSLYVFFLFSILAGSVYIINDIVDIKEDRIHPKKKTRPLASGKLNLKLAQVSSIILPLISIILAFSLNTQTGYLFTSYLLLNLAYSLKLKHVVILDVLIIAAGFVIRVLAGAFVINVPISHWLLIFTLFLAIFLGFCKRRNELESENSTKHRPSLSDYSTGFLDQMISISTASIIITYTLYTTSSDTIKHLGTNNLIYTVPIVLYCIFRYLYLVHQRKMGESPTDVFLSDKSLIISMVIWFLSILLIIYKR